MEHNHQGHWENVFKTKADTQKSWFENYPHTSMKFIIDAGLSKGAAIIDVGGGDSTLVDALLDAGYTNITVLDISAIAIENAKNRLGNQSKNVTWIISDVFDINFIKKFDCWHDRAAFHFVTDPQKVERYVQIMADSVEISGTLIVGTFSDSGPENCSGLPVMRYSQESLIKTLTTYFCKVYCIEEIHTTPFNTAQSFTFCLLKRA